MADKRKVSTDALETLGTIIDENEKRDAIHLAVEPIKAVQKLYPGQDVGLVPGGAGVCDSPVGIVDPFLKNAVMPGEYFWLVVYPRQINSLRHVWSHPAFPEELPIQQLSLTDEEEVGKAEEESSRRWLESFAEKADLTYDELMKGADEYLKYGEYMIDGGKWEGFDFELEF